MTDVIISPSGISPGKAKSKVVKDLIKGSSFSDSSVRTRVDELLRIERYILDGVHSYASALLYHHLKGKYPAEWTNIYEELEPSEFQILRREEEKRLKEQERWRETQRKAEKEREERARRDWQAMGGRP